MADLATSDDVEALYRTLTVDEENQVEALLRMASAMLRGAVPSVDARIAAGSLDAQTVADVVAAMVTRALRNPQGVKQETIGPVSYSTDPRVAAGYLYVDAAELALLAPVSTGAGARGGVGSIRLHAGLG